MRPVITGINENGEDGVVEWVKVKPEPVAEQARIRTLAHRVEDLMLIIVCGRQSGGHSPELQAAYQAQLEQMRRQLGANDQTDMLESLLIERVVLCWLKLQWCEEQSSYTMAAGSSVVMGEHWDKRLDTAHVRFLRAAVALERVRKLRQRPRGMGASAAVSLLKNLAAGDWSAADALRGARAQRVHQSKISFVTHVSAKPPITLTTWLRYRETQGRWLVWRRGIT